MAVAMGLAVAALALTRRAITLHDPDRGVPIAGVMTAQLALNDPRYDDPDQMVRTTTAIVERLSQSPSIEVAALVNYMPLSAIVLVSPVAIEGSPPPAADRPWLMRYFVVSPNYLRAVGIPIV